MSCIFNKYFVIIVELRLTCLGPPMDDIGSLLSMILLYNYWWRLLCFKLMGLVGVQAARLSHLCSMLNIITLDWNVDVLFLSAINLINIVRLLLMKVSGVRSLHDSSLVKSTLERHMMNIGWM